MGMGLSIINALYGDDPMRYLVFLPVMTYHPLQLLLGSALTSTLASWTRG